MVAACYLWIRFMTSSTTLPHWTKLRKPLDANADDDIVLHGRYVLWDERDTRLGIIGSVRWARSLS